MRSRIHAGPACYLNLDRVFPIDRKRRLFNPLSQALLAARRDRSHPVGSVDILGRFCAKGVRLTLPRSVFKPGFLLVGLLGYRHTVTQERDPTIVAHRYDL